MRTLPLDDATAQNSGGKASTLGRLRRAGIDVPDGFVIPVSEFRRHHTGRAAQGAAQSAAPGARAPDPGLVDAIGAQLQRLFGGADAAYLAVRSSGSDEDGLHRSAAGLYETVLAVRGVDAVVAAVARCWASLHSARAAAYRDSARADQPPAGQPPADRPPAMAVLVQRLVDADVSGVLFTQSPRVIEATPGLGALLVGGQVTPDAWTVDDTGIIARRAGALTHRLDRTGEQLLSTPLPQRSPRPMCLDDTTVHELDRLGRSIAAILGHPADVEWAITGRRIHTIQARPITAAVTGPRVRGRGIPASPGVATGTTRVLRGPRDFHRVRPGDILVCRATDPAWTPLFTQAAGIITETGGLLSHAAILARELGIPAILSVPEATTSYPDGTRLTMDGTTGRIEIPG